MNNKTGIVKLWGRRKAFSLVELIVTIAIMAVLVAVLVPAILTYVERSRAQKDESAMDEVVNAVKLALADEYIYDEVTAHEIEENYADYGDDGFSGQMTGVTLSFVIEDGEDGRAYVFRNGVVNIKDGTTERMVPETNLLYAELIKTVGTQYAPTSRTHRNDSIRSLSKQAGTEATTSTAFPYGASSTAGLRLRKYLSRKSTRTNSLKLRTRCGLRT